MREVKDLHEANESLNAVSRLLPCRLTSTPLGPPRTTPHADDAVIPYEFRGEGSANIFYVRGGSQIMQKVVTLPREVVLSNGPNPTPDRLTSQRLPAATATPSVRSGTWGGGFLRWHVGFAAIVKTGYPEHDRGDDQAENEAEHGRHGGVGEPDDTGSGGFDSVGRDME